MAEATGRQAAAKPQESGVPESGVSLDDYMAREERFVEVVNGEMVIMNPPQYEHVEITFDLAYSLRQHAEKQHLGVVCPDGTPYVLDASDRKNWVKNARMPDVSFVARERFEAHRARYGRKGPLRLAPDLAVEVVSPTDAYTEINEKVAEYLRCGVRLVWVIDPEQRVIRVYTPDNPDGRTLHEGDTLSGDPVLPGWSMTVSEILGAA